MEEEFSKMYWELKEKTDLEKYSWFVEREENRQDSKARSFTNLLGGIIIGSLLTAYCWVPSNITVKDIDRDGRADIVVKQMSGVKRDHMQQQNESYKLNTNYLDDLLIIIPW